MKKTCPLLVLALSNSVWAPGKIIPLRRFSKSTFLPIFNNLGLAKLNDCIWVKIGALASMQACTKCPIETYSAYPILIN